MAISRNLYTRGLRQRLGGAVWYTRKGETVARELAASVANPQTTAQMDARVGWNNKVQFYKRSAFWMKWGAFESKKQSWSDYNAFMSANAKKVDVAITKEQAAAGYAVIADYVVTKGSLPAVNVTYSSNLKYVTDLYFGSDADFEATVTVGELSQLLLDNNNGLQAGDQLSFICYLQGGNAGAPTMTCRAFEMILNTQDTTLFNDIVGDFLNVSYEGANGALTMQFTGQGGATIVVSREVSGSLKVSSQTLVLDNAQQAFLANFTSDAARKRAARSYGSAGRQNFLSAGYSGISSDANTAVAVSILSVNGVSAGGVLTLPAASDPNFGTINIVASSLPAGTTTVTVEPYAIGGTNEMFTSGPDPIDDRSFSVRYTLQSATRVARVRVAFNDENEDVLYDAYIDFSTATGGDDNGEGITG